MKIDQVINLPTTPVNAPPYIMSSPEFRKREYFSILYETDIDKLKEVVPEPLDIVEPLVRFEFMNMPDSTALGSYMECGQLVKVSYDGVLGEFNLGMYVDNFPAVAAGREITAYPKKMAKPSLYIDSDTIDAKLAYGTLDVAIATMGYKFLKMTEEEARREVSIPQYFLKIMRDYEGKPLVCELVKSQITKFDVLDAWKSPARLQLFEHVSAPLADLPVRKIIDASHILTNLVLGKTEPVFDYLK
ncbi:MAG: acetoacetate decarboxylase [Firmicutes bacterium]|nr:acetoacetate decarboxylase [Bacillota bacterium]